MIPSRRDVSVSDQFGLMDLQSNYSAQAGAAWDSYFNEGLGMSFVRHNLNRELDASDQSARLSANDAVKIMENSGLPIGTWDLARVKEGQYTQWGLQRYIDEQRERVSLYGIIGDNNGLLRGGSLFLVGLVSTLRDPVEFASNLIPFSRLTSMGRAANLAARQAPTLARRTGARFLAGGIDGGTASIALEPFYASMHSQNPFEQYGLADSFLNVTMGTLMGGGIHSVGGAASDGVRGYFGRRADRAMAPFRRDAELVRTHEGLSRILTQDSERSIVLSREIAQAMPSLRDLAPEHQAIAIRDLGDAVVLSEQIRVQRASDPKAPVIIPEGTLPEVAKMAQFIADNDGSSAIPRLMQNYADALRQRAADGGKGGLQNTAADGETPQTSTAQTSPESAPVDRDAVISRAIEQTANAPESGADQFAKASPDAKWDSLRAAMLEYGQDKHLDIEPVLQADAGASAQDTASAVQRMGDAEANMGYDEAIAREAYKPVDPNVPEKTRQLEAETRDYEQAKTSYEHAEKAYTDQIRYSRMDGFAESAKVERDAITFGEARAAAKVFQGRELINRASGITGQVSRNSLDKMLSGKAVNKSVSAEVHARAVANIDQLFERAILGWSKADSKKQTASIKSIGRFFAPMVHGDRAYLAKITVKETVQLDKPNPIYTIEAVELKEKSSAVEWVDSAAKADQMADPLKRNNAEDVASIAQQVEDFNRLADQTVEGVVQSVRESFDSHTSDLVSSGRIEVVKSVNDLPYGPHPADTKAMTLPDGKVFIVAKNALPEEIKGIVLHEVGVHVGMERMLGADVFRSVKEEMDNAIVRGEVWAQEARRNLPDDTPAAYRQEELIAYVVENHPELSISQKIIAAVRTWVYRHSGIARRLINLNDNDLAYLAVSALRSAANESNTGRGQFFYSREAGEDARPFAEKITDGERNIILSRQIGEKMVELAQSGVDTETMGRVLRETFNDVDPATLRELSEDLDRRINEALLSRAKTAQSQADDLANISQNLAHDMSIDLQRAAIQEQRVRYLNESKRLNNTAFIRDFVDPLYESKPGFWQRRKQAGLDKEAFAALIFGSNLKRRGAKNSIDAVYKSTRDAYTQRMYSDLQKRGAWEALKNRENWRDIFNAVIAIGKTEDTSRFSPEVRNVAEVLVNLNEHMRQAMNAEGAWIGKLDDFVIAQTHDSTKLIQQGFEAWRDFVLPRLDVERTFTNRGVTNINQALRQMYDALSSGIHEKEGPDRVASTAFGAGRSVARSASESRLIHFKDGNAQFEYSQEFGHGDLIYSIAGSIDYNARNVSLMHRLGTNPQNALVRLMDEHMDRVKTDPARARAFSGSRKQIQDMFKHVDGSLNIPVGENLAKWGSATRASQSVSKLGGALMSSLADLPVMASELRAWDGGNILGKTWGSIKATLGILNPYERKILLETMGYLDASIMGSIASRFDSPDLVPGALSKGMFLFFKMNGLTGWTENMRRGFTMELGSIWARYAEQSFNDLPAMTRTMFEWYNIDEKRWEVLRHAVLSSEDGRSFMGPEGIKSIPDQVFEKYLRDTGRDVSPAAIERAKADLERDLRTALVDRMNTAVVEPGAKTRYTMYRGTQPGTAEGELLRMAMQFKSFPVAMLQLVFGRDIYGKGFDTLEDFVRHGRGAMVQLASFIALSTMFGYVAMSAKDVTKGKEPRPLDRKETWIAAFTQGGGLGIYGDFLFGEYNRMGGGLTATLAGPTLGTADQIANIYARVRSGDDAAAAAFNTALQNTPFVNLFYVRPAMNYLILNRMQEALNPGYHRRMQNRLRQQNGQEVYEWSNQMFGG